MLKDVVDFVLSRTGFPTREQALREINFAWVEIWNSDDLPNSLFEMSVQPFDNTARISLPHFVGQLRGVKLNAGRIRVDLMTPRPYYQDDTYFQSPYVWRILGVSPIATAITNATTLNLSISEAEDIAFTATLIGPTDNAAEDSETVTFEIGDTEKQTVKRFTDLTSVTKSALTKSNLVIQGANDEEFGFVANNEYEARNTIVQITDKCFKICNNCRCFDVLFKKPAPILYNENAVIPFEEVLMTKTLEWIALPKDGQEQKAILFGEKAKTLLTGFNNDGGSVEKRMDLGRNKFTTRYYGHL